MTMSDAILKIYYKSLFKKISAQTFIWIINIAVDFVCMCVCIRAMYAQWKSLDTNQIWAVTHTVYVEQVHSVHLIIVAHYM